MRMILYEDGHEDSDHSDIIQLVTAQGKVDVACMMDELPPKKRRELARRIVAAFNKGK